MRALMKRPGMFVGPCESEESFRYAVPLIMGMSCFDNTGIMDSFQNWLKFKKFCKSSPFGWPYMVEKYFEQQQVNPRDYVFAFIDLFTEFLESQNIHADDPIKRKIKLKISDHDPNVAYLTLPDHPGKNAYDRFDQKTEGFVSRTQEIKDLIPDYKGPDINLDFDKEGTLIGIEILA